MADFGLAPARPGQAVVVAADLRRVLRRPKGNDIELVLMLHMRLEALRRLAAITGRPAAAIDLPQKILGARHVVLDLDVLEQRVGEAELLRQEVYYFVVGLRLKDRLHDLLPPLEGAVRGRAIGREHV